MIDLNTLKNRIAQLTEVGYNLNYCEYLRTANKELIVLEIDNENKRFNPISENCPVEILKGANSSFFSAKAGYAIDAHKNFNSTFSCDILLLASDVINGKPQEFDTILVHELAHWVLNSSQSLPNFEKDAISLGKDIFDRTDQDYMARTQHSLEFCNLLAHGCIQYNQKYSVFPTALECIENAMRYDIDF